MKEFEKTMKALANRRRLVVITLLHQKGERCVSDIAQYLKLSMRSTSRHLSVLYHANVLERSQIGSAVYYFLPPTPPLIVKAILPLISDLRKTKI